MNDLVSPATVLVVVLGGLFGWTLGRLPDRWVFAIMAAALLLGILVFSQAA